MSILPQPEPPLNKIVPIRAIQDEDAPPYDADFSQRRDPFVMIPTDVGDSILETLGGSAFGVYWHLARRSKDGECWPSLDEIADATHQSRMNTTRMLNILERDGWVERIKRSNKRGMSTSNLYKLPHLLRTYGGNKARTEREHSVLENVTRTRVELDVKQPSVANKPPLSPKPKRTQSTKTPVPDDLVIPLDVWSKIGAEQHMTDDEMRVETEKMQDYYRGKGERRSDWVASWRSWMRSPYRKPGVSQNGHANRPTKNGRVGYTFEELVAMSKGETIEPERDDQTVVDAEFHLAR